MTDGLPEPHPALHTRLCELTGVRYPIVQTGMGWVAGPRLVAATAAAGALGILASATMSFDELAAAIDEVKKRTDAPFGVNLRTDSADAAERVELLIEQQVRVASFAQAPRPEMVARLAEAGVFVMPTVGARRHAEKVAAWGVHGVIAQGAEGGGHTGEVPTSLLLPAVVEAVGDKVAVIGAGGFHDGRGLVAALAYGASGIAMGTRFLLTKESTVPDVVKERYLETTITGTVVTTRVDGAPQRVIRTELVERLQTSGRVTALPRALRNALAFRRTTHSSMRALLREGLAMKEGNE
ncbi:MAG TPA: nitronate monooxygenase, partial [Acidimicrobiales bacterium]|nr:nitronate monooxygenase [Acidimicrobiales bacterium]